MTKPSQDSNSSSLGTCLAGGCKKDSRRFGFCDEHFEHYKFGLINKNGQPVPDYDKKIEHFLAHTKKQGKKGVPKAA